MTTLSLAVVLLATGLDMVPVPAWAAPQSKAEQAQRYDAVRSAGAAKTTAPAADPTENAAKVTRPAPVWPVAASAATDLAPEPLARSASGAAQLKAGSLPVRVGAPKRGIRPAKVKVEVLSQAAAKSLGVNGVLYRVSRADGSDNTAAVRLSTDFAAFSTAYGADWASRLRLSSVPECALTDPESPDCQVVPLESTSDLKTSTVTADIALTAAKSTTTAGLAELRAPPGNATSLVALSAGPSGGSGDFGATSLAASATWGHTGSTGGFTWSYPMRVPPSVGGPAPQVGLNYSSQSVDGRHAASNNQPGWIGEGFSYETGFIERRYKTCSEDMGADSLGRAANNTTKTYDLCWDNYNAVMSLNGQAMELLKGADGRWHGAQEDGSRIELLSEPGFANGDQNNEYWRVTSADGRKYWFGRHRLPGWAANQAVTNSVLTVPVAGNHVDDPCHAATFAGSFCAQAWRWQLDYIEDALGNTSSLWYTRDTNYYARNLSQSNPVAYHRDGVAVRIDYGTDNRSGVDTALTSTKVPAQVHFGTSDRCLANCATHNATTWPDTPWDTECQSTGTCQVASPTFWSSKRLTTVTTKVWKAAAGQYQDVDSWTLRQSFPDPGDTTRAGLWLDGIIHRGLNGAAIALPEVTFAGVQMNNRVDAGGEDWAQAMNWWRISRVKSETGGEIAVTYSDPECVAGSVMPANPGDNNTLRCYPVRWTPQGKTADITDYFHKYVVKEIQQIDNTGHAPASKIAYEYENPQSLPLWHYDGDDGLVKADRKSWGQWRGYPYVVTKVGEGATQQVSKVLYFRGMHGDKTASGTRTVTVAGLEGGPVNDLEAYGGMPREQVGYLAGQVISGVVTTPWQSTTPTASRTINGSLVESRYVGVERTDNRALLTAGGWRRTASATEFDQQGIPTKIKNLGDPSSTTDDKCTSNEYIPNADPNTWILRSPKRVRSWVGDCATGPADAGQVVSDLRFSYDQQAYGAVPTDGLVSRIERADAWNGGNPTFQVVGTYKHDAHGRTKEATDIAGRVTKAEFTPANGGPMTSVKTINNASWFTTVDFDPAWGLIVKETDANTRVTEAQYDALGRRRKVWLADRPSVSNLNTPSAEYLYAVNTATPSSIETKTLNANGAYLSKYELFDSLLRPRQTQSPAVGGGRVVTDTYYNNFGAVWKTNDAYPTTGNPGTILFEPVDLDVPSQTRHEFDSAGRVTSTVFYAKDVEQWRTRTAYHGDHVDSVPPRGGTPTTIYTDIEGRTTRLLEYHGSTASGPADETLYRYYPTGEQKEVQDASGNLWQFEYDDLGRKTKVVSPNSGATSYTYNTVDELLTSTDEAGGTTLAYTYEPLLGRLSTVRDGTVTGNKRIEWAYDAPAKGLTKSTTRWIGSDQYKNELVTADALYRPTQTKVSIPLIEGGLAGSYAIRTTYKPDGSPNTVTLPGVTNSLAAETLTYEYDTTLGLPKALSTNYGDVTHYVTDAGYTNLGEPSFIIRSTALTGATFVQSLQNYDEATHRVKRRAVLKSVGSAYITDANFTYDPAGNIEKIDDNPLNGPRDTQCFTYDHLRRLTEAWTPASANCSTAPASTTMGGAAPYWTTWSFGSPTDATGRAGSRLREVDHLTPGGVLTTDYAYPAQGVAGTKPHTVTGYTVKNGAGQTVKTADYTYDAAGNTKTRPGPAGEQTLNWDAEGHLANSTDTTGTSRYVYDAEGNRLLSKTPSGTTLHLGSMEIRLTGASLATTRYYTFNGETVAQRTGSGVVWLCSDHQGTGQVAVTADATQTVTKRRQTPFGEARGAGVSWPNPKGFAGGDLDPTGLVHMGAREYDADLGRFISADPVIDLSDPQQLHGYTYANHSPITFSDPSGLWLDGCRLLMCGVLDGFKDATDPSKIVANLLKVILHLRETWKELHNEAQKWTERIGEASIGWACALSGICSMFETCAQTSQAYECGYELGTLLADLLIAAATAASGAAEIVAKRAAEIAAKMAKKYGIPNPKIKTGSDGNPSGDNTNGNGGKTEDGEGGPPVNKTEDGGRPAKKTENNGDRTGKDGDDYTDMYECKVNSFDPDTPVVMADGSAKAIKDVAIGDEVLATDPETGETTAQTVTHLHLNLDTDLTDLTVVNELGETRLLKTTDHHPFWSDTAHAWVDAAKLTPGDRLRTADHHTLLVLRVYSYAGASAMRNLEVSNVHTYYVLAGDTPVLVHNGDTTRAGVTRTNRQDWLNQMRIWDNDDVYKDILSKGNRWKIENGLVPKVDRQWVQFFPGDAHLIGEKITMHHIGGNKITVALPKSRHEQAHMPGGTSVNPGGPGMCG